MVSRIFVDLSIYRSKKQLCILTGKGGILDKYMLQEGRSKYNSIWIATSLYKEDLEIIKFIVKGDLPMKPFYLVSSKNCGERYYYYFKETAKITSNFATLKKYSPTFSEREQNGQGISNGRVFYDFKPPKHIKATNLQALKKLIKEEK